MDKVVSNKKTVFLNTPVLYAMMITLGILAGCNYWPWLNHTGLFVAEIFIKLFKCLSLPIIALSIIVTLIQTKTEGKLRLIWRRTLTYTFTTTFVAALVSMILYRTIAPSMMSAAEVITPVNQAGNYWNFIQDLIPSSFITPFIEQKVISVLLIGLVLGLGIRFIPDEEPRHIVSSFFIGLHAVFMVLTRWLIKVIPIGIFGFITVTVNELQQGQSLAGLGEYLLVVIFANLIQGFIILPLWLKLHGVHPYVAMKKMMPALTLAFFSKSSVGSLPVTMNTIEKNLGVKSEISRMVLPLCTSLNMNGCAAFIFATVTYLLQNHGVELSLSSMLVWVFVATIAAIGNAGVPMGCFFLSASLLASMNVPLSLLGLILPFYSLIDMLETALNVWSDSCVAKVVNDKVNVNLPQKA